MKNEGLLQMGFAAVLYHIEKGNKYMLKWKNYQNWALYPKLILLCFSIFSLARAILEEVIKAQTAGRRALWLGVAVVSFLLSLVFHWCNKSEELKRITHASGYREAYGSVEILYKKVMGAVEDKDTKVFVSRELQYLRDPIKQYIFLKGISDKLGEA